MSHLPLDARAILHYLNELGYRNISSTQLKEFLKDLRKLIKYEERMGVNTQQNDYYEGLFRRTTASFRAKLDKENAERLQTKNKIFDLQKPTTSKQAGKENHKILYERNYFETSSSSYETFDRKKYKTNYKPKTDKACLNISVIKALIDEKLTQVLSEKNSPETDGVNISSKEKMTIRLIVEDILKEKLTDSQDPEMKKINTSEPGSLRSMIESIIEQILKDKFSNIQKMNSNEPLESIEKDFQQKLNFGNEKMKTSIQEPLIQNNFNRPLDSQAIVDDLLDFGNSKNKKTFKNNKENHIQNACDIKRLQRSPRKKPEWQDPRPHDEILDKPQRPLRARSPAPSSSALSRRSKYSSSVMIRRLPSQRLHKKPNSDPVALYQYYKNEWEHFRKQIPGETSHNRLRWHVRQHLLDPE